MALADRVADAVAAWDFNESSGTRVDQVDDHDAAESGGTVNSASGVFGNAAVLTGAPELVVSNHADFAAGAGDICIWLWVKLTSKAADSYFMGQWEGSNNESWLLYYRQDIDRIRIVTSQSGGAADAICDANNLGSPSTDTWYLIVLRKSGSTLGISVNAGTEDTTTMAYDWRNVSNNRIGRGSGTFHIDDAGVLIGSYLDATERTELYNGGTGVAFEDWAGGGGSVFLHPRRRYSGIDFSGAHNFRTPGIKGY